MNDDLIFTGIMIILIIGMLASGLYLIWMVISEKKNGMPITLAVPVFFLGLSCVLVCSYILYYEIPKFINHQS